MNKKFLTLGVASLLTASSFAQVKPLVPNKDAIRFSKAINPENGFKHLSVLASDEYEGRETGKKGAWMAADYIRNYFKSIGLKGPVNGEYFQKIDLVNLMLKESHVTLNGQVKDYQKDYLVLPNTISDKGFTFSSDEVVFVGYGDMFPNVSGKKMPATVVQTIYPSTSTAKSSFTTTNGGSNACSVLINELSLSKTTLKKGDRGFIVFALQMLLKQKNATSSALSLKKSGSDAFGTFGDNTSSLLMKFQTLHKLKATGNLDAQTKTELIRALYNGPNSCKQLTL